MDLTSMTESMFSITHYPILFWVFCSLDFVILFCLKHYDVVGIEWYAQISINCRLIYIRRLWAGDRDNVSIETIKRKTT